MNVSSTNLVPDLYFSYSQFFVYDASVQMPASEWTQGHSDQGFARRAGTVALGTLLEYGIAKVAVTIGPYQPTHDCERAIAVPFAVVTGMVIVEGPEETEPGRQRSVEVPPGDYRLVVTQRTIGDEEEAISLYFEPQEKRLERSTILVADDGLNPPEPLLESARIAGQE